MQETWVSSLGREDPLEEEMATHSSILAWRIPVDRGAWWATVHRVTKSQTWLKRLSSSSTILLNLHNSVITILYESYKIHKKLWNYDLISDMSNYGKLSTRKARWFSRKGKFIQRIAIWVLQPWCAYSLSHVRLFVTPWTVAHKAPLSIGFSRQEYWRGLPCPPPGDLPNPGI